MQLRVRFRPPRPFAAASSIAALVFSMLAAVHAPAQTPPQPTVATTDPALTDSDGDGYLDGPDAWVSSYVAGTLTRTYFAGEDKNGNGRNEPKGEDDIAGTGDDESDPMSRSSHPNSPAIVMAGIDTDSDGLFDHLEPLSGCDPFDRDTDDDGLLDGDEVHGIGRCLAGGFRRQTDPMNPDSDADGIPDGTELGVFGDNPTGIAEGTIKATDTSAEFHFRDFTGQLLSSPTYVPDADQGSRATLTNPLDRDTNGDGVEDGAQDKNRNGAYEPLGTDATADTDDDEQDAVVGFRKPNDKKSMFLNMSLTLPEYDSNDKYLYDPPSKTQLLDFYWGSLEADEVVLNVESPGKIAVAPLRFARVPGIAKQSISFTASAGLGEGEIVMVQAVPKVLLQNQAIPPASVTRRPFGR